MPENSEQPNPFDSWDDADRIRLSNKFMRGAEILRQAVFSGRTAELAPCFRAFFAFCDGRRLTPEAQDFVDSLRAMAGSFNIEVDHE